MEIIEEKVNHGIKYNYWIYLLTGITLIGCLGYFTARDSMTGVYDYSKIIKAEGVIITSLSIAWVIGKRYNLHYALICGLAGFCEIVVILLIEMGSMLIRISLSVGVLEAFKTIPEFVPLIVLFLLPGLVLGGLILVTSYPFQYLYLKLKNHRNLQ